MVGPKHFWEVHYLGNLAEWQKSPDDIRLAMNTIVSANQLADWVFEQSKLNGNPVASSGATYRDQLTQRTTEFGIVRDVADCHKHFALTRSTAAVTAAQDIRNVGTFSRDFSDDFDVSRIEITDKCQTVWQLEATLNVVTEMWKAELTRLKMV